MPENLYLIFFAITVNSLRVVGGIIFVIVCYDMLQARLNRTKSREDDHFEDVKDVAISPPGIPLITGSGAITVTIGLYNDAVVDLSKKLVLLIIMLAVLLTGRKVMSFIGENGNKPLMRILGLIVMVIYLEFLFSS